MLRRRTMEKARNKLKPLLQILNWKRVEIMSVADFTQDARVSPMFPPNKCANTRKSTSHCTCWKFSSLTENCQTTDAAISVRLFLTEKIIKNSKEESIFKSTTFASYRIFLVQITTCTISFEKVQYIPAWIAREFKRWSCAPHEHITNGLYEFTLKKKVQRSQRSYPASSGFPRTDTTLRWEINHCEQPFAFPSSMRVHVMTTNIQRQDGIENFNKTTGLISKTTTLHVHHAFILHFFAILARLRREHD